MTDTAQAHPGYPPEINHFIQALWGLDRGDRAVLRRSAGSSIAEGRSVMQLFYRLLPVGVDARKEEVYFLVATLFALYNPGETSPRMSGNFGATMQAVRFQSDRDLSKPNPLDRRFALLLESDAFGEAAGELGFRLRQAVKLADSRRVGIHWEQLLQDLLSWHYPSKSTQKAWARAYYQEPRAQSDSEQKEGGR